MGGVRIDRGIEVIRRMIWKGRAFDAATRRHDEFYVAREWPAKTSLKQYWWKIKHACVINRKCFVSNVRVISDVSCNGS
jgi:hypothetical protein